MKSFPRNAALSAVVSLMLSACSSDKSVDEYLAQAKQSIQNNDVKAATILLKNAIRADLQNAESRYLLGEIYTSQGLAAAAEKELKKAIELGKAKEAVYPHLLRALYLQEKHDEVIELADNYRQLALEAIAPAFLYRALSLLKLGKTESAKDTFVQLNELYSDTVYGQLGLAYLKVDAADIEAAIELSNNIILQNKTFAEAYLFLAQLYESQGFLEKAISQYTFYFELVPQDLKARLFLANVYIKNHQLEPAREHLLFLLNLVPEHPFSNQLLGVVSYQTNEYQLALAHTEKAIQNGINSTANRIVAGLSAFQLKRYEIAYQYLSTIEDELSAESPIKKILAVTQMTLGHYLEAGTTLNELKGLTDEDVDMLTAASFELLQKGNVDAAKSLISKTENIAEQNGSVLTRLGMLKLSVNDLQGIADLEKAIDLSPEQPVAKLALVSAYLQTKSYVKAHQVADNWIAQQPNDEQGYNLKARIYLAEENFAEAENLLTQVLQNNALSVYPNLYFANKALIDNNPNEADRILSKLLAEHPDNQAALILYYRTGVLLTNTDAAVERIKSAFERHKESLNYMLLYANSLYGQKNYQQAVDIIEKSNFSEDVSNQLFWEIRARSYLALAKHEKALSVYDSWIRVQPASKHAITGKLSLLEQMTKYRDALRFAEQVVDQYPDDKGIAVLIPYYHILLGDVLQAEAAVDKLSDDQIETPMGQGIIGQIQMKKGNFKAAVQSLDALYKAFPASRNAMMLYKAKTEAVNERNGYDFLKEHVENYPSDQLIKNVFAELAINYDKPLAKKYFEQLIELNPEHGIMLNNLAWVDYELGNHELAEKRAEQAKVLTNGHPQVLDTLAMIKLKLGKKQEAVELLKEAVKKAPNDPDISAHLKATMM